MQYLSVAEVAKKWNVSERSVRNYCAQGRVPEAFLKGKIWYIPENAEKPERSNKKEQPVTLLDVLQDEKAMYAYEHAFSDQEVQQWLDRQQQRYREYGFGLWAVILKESGAMIGQCGLTMQKCHGREVLEIGYLFERAFWHCGYATEAAMACRNYAFETLGVSEVYSIIRDSNVASQNVAKRNGMTQRSTFVKHYYHMDMPHLVFSITRQEYFKTNNITNCKKGTGA